MCLLGSFGKWAWEKFDHEATLVESGVVLELVKDLIEFYGISFKEMLILDFTCL